MSSQREDMSLEPGRSPLTGWMAPPAVGDLARLAAVRGTGLLDGVPVGTLDHLTDLAARLLGAPLAFLTMVDDQTSHWVSCAGLAATDPRQNSVEESFCQYVVADRSPLVVDDAAVHPRTRDNPSVVSMGVRAWAGYPVLDADGRALGSFCVVDTAPRAWQAEQVEVLRVLAAAASAQVQRLTTERVAAATAEAALRLSVVDSALSQMADLALRVGAVESLDALVEVVVEAGLPALGADGGAIVLRDDAAGLARVLVTDRLGRQVQDAYGVLPLDNPLPAVHTARTGEPVVLPTRAAGVEFTEEMAGVYERTGRSAWAFAPMRVDGHLLGSLATAWTEERPCSPGELRLLDAIASLCAQTVLRLQRRDEQHTLLQTVRGMSETLQRSLLTQPAPRPGLDVAVRYEPAAQEAQVGGDWHDAFVTTSGRLTLVVGDVSGHDQIAAAAMGQARNLVRGLTFDSTDGPAQLLARLDGALRGLQLDTYATAVLAQIDEPHQRRDPGATGPDTGHDDEAGTGTGVHRMRWSSAGHLPPMLRSPDGTVRVLTTQADLMLGVEPGTPRTERVVDLEAGSTVLLYSDGLVERRGVPVDESLDALARVFADVGGHPTELVCDRLLHLVAGESHEDDVAVLVLRVSGT